MLIPSAPAFVAALVSAALAAVAMLRGQRSVAQWAFAAGMVLLGAESICTGMTLRLLEGPDHAKIMSWLRWSHTIKAFLPLAWLLFSATYARGNAATFLTRRRYFLGSVFLAALVVAIELDEDALIESSPRAGGAGYIADASDGRPAVAKLSEIPRGK